MKEPKISICRNKSGFKIACFDQFECIRDFIQYDESHEKKGIKEAEKFFKSKGVSYNVIKIVRPIITKMILRS